MTKEWRIIMLALKRRYQTALAGEKRNRKRQFDLMLNWRYYGGNEVRWNNVLRDFNVTNELWEKDKEDIRLFLQDFFSSVDNAIRHWGVTRATRDADIDALCRFLKDTL